MMTAWQNDKSTTIPAIIARGVVRIETRTPGRLRARRIMVLAVPPAEELDIVGPWDVFASVNNALAERGRAYAIELVIGGKQRSFRGDSGLTIVGDSSYTNVSGDPDTLVVVGGTGAIRSRDRAISRWIRQKAKAARRVASICTGAFLLAEAGLLDGRRATTHWMFTGEMATRFPKVKVDPDPIFVRDGNVYTSAGVTAGMDLALALVEEDLGSAMALRIARTLVLFLRRPGGQSQFSTLLSGQASEIKPLRELGVWMTENLGRDLSVSVLASRVAMSDRNFARVFARELGVTPARYVEQLRLEAARRELELSDRGMEEVALASGFSSAELLRRAFMRRYRISPHAYRDHFSRRVKHARHPARR
jgi:transcriptional regulator GlxA family with amidase domain